MIPRSFFSKIHKMTLDELKVYYGDLALKLSNLANLRDYIGDEMERREVEKHEKESDYDESQINAEQKERDDAQ